MRDDKQEKRVGIWIRVSTEDQVRGESPETHERRARAYADSRDWQVMEVYRLDAVSGKTVKDHPEAKRMLGDIRSGHISGLIFSKLARLARNTKELLEFAEHFRDAGADLVSLAEAIDTSTPAGRLFYTMIAAMAQWEREEIASRVAASVPIRAQMGKPLGGQAPFGYQWVEKELHVDPAEAPVRKLMYELFKEHRRKKTVARLLNDRGYRTRNGSPFSDTTVDRLLRDPTAKGVRRANYTESNNSKGAWKLKPESSWVLTPVEAIISEDLWSEVNVLLDEKRVKGQRQTKQVVHLFSGLTFCECSAKMYVPSNSPKYICKPCRNKIPVDDLEQIFKAELRAFVFSPAEISEHVEAGNVRLKGLEDLLSALEAEQRKVTGEADKLIELYQANVLDKKGFGVRYEKLRDRLHQIEEELPGVQAKRDVLHISLLSQEEVLASSKDLVERWDGLPTGERRHVVETIVDRVTIGKGEVEFEFLYNPGGTLPPTSPPSPSGTSGAGNGGTSATQLQGFIAATSWKRAGNIACRAAREIVMRPVSSGSRSASSAARGNSGVSSRNSIPPCASEISPGRGGEPPPTSAGALAEWCGARTGLWPKAWASKPCAVRPCKAALTRASSASIGGRMPGRRCASIDLPVPGGPMSSRLCEPAAAISSARLAPAWPLTSRRSGPGSGGGGGSATATGSGTAASPGSSACTTCVRWLAARTSMPPTWAAARALSAGSTKARTAPARRTARPKARAPRTGRSSPASDSSPANSCAASRAGSSRPAAARMPSAMGRSKRPDSLGRSAGARLTVMRLLCGNAKPLCCSAARTRSRDSLTSVSASPTSVKLGRPLANCTSTCTSGASSASSARLITTASVMRQVLPRRLCPWAAGWKAPLAAPLWSVILNITKSVRSGCVL